MGMKKIRTITRLLREINAGLWGAAIALVVTGHTAALWWFIAASAPLMFCTGWLEAAASDLETRK